MTLGKLDLKCGEEADKVYLVFILP